MFGSGVQARNAVFARRSRRVAALGVAGLGACAVLAACSPVKMGAAAIVGNDRITVAALSSQVGNLKAAAKPLGSQVTLTPDKMPTTVLSWLIRFDVMDQVAADHGISLTSAQVQAGVANVNSQVKAAAAQEGLRNDEAVLVNAGIPPQMLTAIGRYQAQEIAYAKKVNGGKLPATSAENNAVTAKFNTAECKAAKKLNIQVSPQFGRLDYTQLAVVAAPDTLSRPEGVPTPASTTGLTPAC